jgi:hypothetical protein
MANQPTAKVSDATLLAALQLIQPAAADDVVDMVAGADWAEKLTKKRVGESLARLCEAGFLHEAGGMGFVLTPIGSALAARSMKPKERDLLRILILNRSRHTNELRWMHR